jgi:lipopolysaccharide/colanic/teichoic acid biosynthesis glycosyltransferase
MYNRQLENDFIHQQWVKDWKNGKFRSDSPDAVVKPLNDPRVTRVGRFLRETSLDELPQICNILKGNMSMVGPRPVPIYEVREYSDWHYHRLDVLPGLTGWWQVNLRGRGTLEQMVELDLEYIRQRSIWFDIRIILKTIPVVVFHQGAR